MCRSPRWFRAYLDVPTLGRCSRVHLFWLSRLKETESSWLALQPSQFTNETDLERGNDLPKTVELVNCGLVSVLLTSFHMTDSFPLYQGGCSYVFFPLSSVEMNLTVLPGLWAILSSSLSSPGYITNLQMLVCGVQQRMNSLSLHW